MSTPLFLECTACHHQQAYVPMTPAVCAACGSSWVEPHYDYTAFKRDLLCGLPGRPQNIWRYADLLPVKSPPEGSPVRVGWTPLMPAQRYGRRLGHGQIWIKDERYGPTNSFKDRQAAVSVAAMLEAGVYEAVIASTGNAAVAYSAACARAGVKLWVFMTSRVPPEKLREVALFGSEVVKVSGTYDQTKLIAAQFARRRGLLLDRGVLSLPGREAMKTIAYEIVEQLGWRAPDWYVQSVSGGLGPLGVYHGFRELYDIGLIDKIPALAILQTEGCAPMVQAFRAGSSTATPVSPETRITVLATGDPGQTYTHLWNLIQQHGGVMEAVSDAEAYLALCNLAKDEGITVEPATAVAFAGVEKLVRQGVIHPDHSVVINCSGHTFPVEKHVLGQLSAVDVRLDSANQRPHEGLDAALEELDEQATSVLLVDDNEDDIQLIRRLLEARKKYRIMQAADGWDALAQARQRLPDLIVLDLMMPGLDGFGVLEELKMDERTRRIPIVVVSAKDITPEERARLNGSIERIYQKGLIPTHVFVDQMVAVLEHNNSPEHNRP